MARITVEDCFDKVEGPYDLVLIAKERAVQLNSGEQPNVDIEKDKNVQLLYSGTSDMEFLSVYGEAFIETNREVIKELYSKADNAWFDGDDDPSITAIRVNPKEAYYWDNKDSKMVTLFKLGMAAVTGDDQDIGEKGKLNV